MKKGRGFFKFLSDSMISRNNKNTTLDFQETKDMFFEKFEMISEKLDDRNFINMISEMVEILKKYNDKTTIL